MRLQSIDLQASGGIQCSAKYVPYYRIRRSLVACIYKAWICSMCKLGRAVKCHMCACVKLQRYRHNVYSTERQLYIFAAFASTHTIKCTQRSAASAGERRHLVRVEVYAANIELTFHSIDIAANFVI